jgi:hypothetical protein
MPTVILRDRWREATPKSISAQKKREQNSRLLFSHILLRQTVTGLARDRPKAFSSEVDTGSREENALKQKPRAPFRCNRNWKSSRSQHSAAADDAAFSNVSSSNRKLHYFA